MLSGRRDGATLAPCVEVMKVMCTLAAWRLRQGCTHTVELHLDWERHWLNCLFLPGWLVVGGVRHRTAWAACVDATGRNFPQLPRPDAGRDLSEILCREAAANLVDDVA